MESETHSGKFMVNQDGFSYWSPAGQSKGGIVDERVNQCSKCNEILPSRNKLFKHIKNCKKEVSTNSSLI